MNILYLGYWNLKDPLTEATIFPNLEILENFEFISKIIFCNTERELKHPVFEPGFKHTKIEYCPIFSGPPTLGIITKIVDFIRFPKQLARVAQREHIDIVVARGAVAGSLAYFLWKTTQIPFVVESFEPHADYMEESGVWYKHGIQYFFQRKWEAAQKKHAKGLIPVAQNYRRKLLEEGVLDNRIRIAPCYINFQKFYFDEAKIKSLRKERGISESTTVGIYAGKYGGLYLEEECFELYAGAFRCFSDFQLIILTPTQFHAWVFSQVARHKLPVDRILVKSVTYEEVPEYLMMSDFAYATYKSGYSKAYLSPVKIGEYWACGLPVILTRGVGDESEFITNKAGVLFDPESINVEKTDDIYRSLSNYLHTSQIRRDISLLARNYRNKSRTIDAYKFFVSPQTD